MVAREDFLQRSIRWGDDPLHSGAALNISVSRMRTSAGFEMIALWIDGERVLELTSDDDRIEDIGDAAEMIANRLSEAAADPCRLPRVDE